MLEPLLSSVHRFGGAPQVISWFIIPLTIDISPTKTIVIGVNVFKRTIKNQHVFFSHPDPSCPAKIRGHTGQVIQTITSLRYIRGQGWANIGEVVGSFVAIS